MILKIFSKKTRKFGNFTKNNSHLRKMKIMTSYVKVCKWWVPCLRRLTGPEIRASVCPNRIFGKGKSCLFLRNGFASDSG
jgi:hypothetical protein